MAKGLVNESSLNSIAEAINVLNGTNGEYYPSEMGAAILDAIPTEEVTDDIVSVTDAAAYPAEKLEFAIEPVQDLHGYDRPWPAGGGKNLFDIENANSNITVNGESFTVPAVTGVTWKDFFTYQPTLAGNYDITQLDKCLYLKAGTYAFSIETGVNASLRSVDPTTGATSAIVDINSTSPSPQSFTLESDSYVTLRVRTNSSYSNLQIELGSTATSYEPYSNICPISGWTGVNGERTGKNLLDPDKMVGYSSGRGYRWYENDGYVLKANQTYAFSVSNTSESVRLYVIEKTTENNLVDASSFLTYTPTEDITVYFQAYCQQGIGEANNFQLELGSTATTYEPYQGTSIPITFPTEAGTVYGGKVDVINGKLLAYPEYDSYNGETLTGKWISSMDAYVEGTTPTIGAQVVDLSGVGIEYDITPRQVQMLLGDNNIGCDTGATTLEYKVDLGRYIEKLKVSQTTPQLSLSRQAVSLDEGEIEKVDEPAEEKEEAEELPVEDVKSVDVAEDEPAELFVEEDTEAKPIESEIQVKEPDTLEKEGGDND